MKLGDLATYIARVGARADRNTFNAFGSFLSFFQSDLKSRAPIDSGKFRDAWKATSVSNLGEGFTSTISNKEAHAPSIEFGSAPGGKPWASPGLKTVMSNGRIYSSQAVGGTIDKTFNNKNVAEFAELIANSILRAFK